MWLFIQSAKKARNLQRSEKMGSFEICFTPLFTFSLPGTMRVTPSLPQRGRQPKRGISSPPLWSDFSINVLMIIAMWGMPGQRGWLHNVQRAPRSDCLFLSWVSTKSKIGILFVCIFCYKIFDVKNRMEVNSDDSINSWHVSG
jgi:hypothetical protein